MNRFTPVVFVACVLAAGCEREVPPVVRAYEKFGVPAEMYDAQVAALNDAIVANHPHFTSGQPRSPSLNVDAFDFMVGNQFDDFREVMDLGKPISIENAGYIYGERLADWMTKISSESNREVTYYLFLSRIGLTFGFEAQADWLLIASQDETILDWQMFSITAY